MMAAKNMIILKSFTICTLVSSLVFADWKEYPQSEEFSEEHERGRELLEEKENIRYEVVEKILYIKDKMEKNRESFTEILTEYEELERELIRDIEILKRERQK